MALEVFGDGGIELFGDYWLGKTLDAAVAKGTWTVTGTWTIPAVSLGGAVAGGDQAFTNVGDMTFAAGSILASGSTNGNTLLLRANDTTFITLTTGATDTLTLGAMTLSGAIAGGDQSWTNMGDMTFAAGSIIASGSTNGNTLLLKANDTTLLTLTTGATDILDIGAHTISGAVAVADNTIFALGTSSDGVLLNISAGNNANTAIAGAIVGTPVTQAFAANSIAFSNITASGDIGVYVNNGGNSLEVLWADASAGTLTIGHGMAGVTIKTNSGDLTLAPAGDWINLDKDVFVDGAVDIYLNNNTSWLYTNGSATAGLNTNTLKLAGTTSGVVTIGVVAAAGTWTMTLPTAVGTAGFQLTDAAGDGITSWAAAGSLREYKNISGVATPTDALDTILGTSVYRFHYKEGKGTQDKETEYVGVVGEEAPWAMHYKGGVVNPVNTLGYMVLGMQALDQRITALEGRA